MRNNEQHKAWMHRVNYEGGYDILRDDRKLTIGYSDVAADATTCRAIASNNRDEYEESYHRVYGGGLDRNRWMLWHFVVDMKIDDIVIVPIYGGFEVYRITSSAKNIVTSGQNSMEPSWYRGQDLGWYHEVEFLGRFSPREEFANDDLCRKMRCQKSTLSLSSDLYSHIVNDVLREEQKHITAKPYLASSPFETAHWLMDGILHIPPVQRGLVWKPQQVEALWDSILRRFPIGTFSIRPKHGEDGIQERRQDTVKNVKSLVWELLDGQQRCNALMTGYDTFPPKSRGEGGRESDAWQRPILWIDLIANEGDKLGRFYGFYVTTAAHPWGYKKSPSNDEVIRLDQSVRRDMAERVDWHGKKSMSISADKPYPSELWPSEGDMPVPFELVDRFCREFRDGLPDEKSTLPAFNEFLAFCQKVKTDCGDTGTIHPWNWLDENLRLRIEKMDAEAHDRLTKTWENLVKAIDAIEDFVIFQMNASAVPVEDIGLYFKRVGIGGSTPTSEEMDYSILKNSMPENFKTVMDSAGGVGVAEASRMAAIAISSWSYAGKSHSIQAICADKKNDEGNGGELWKAFLAYIGDVSGYRADYRAETFWGRFNRVKYWLSGEFNDQKDANGLLLWHMMQMCSGNKDPIFQYLLRLAGDNKIAWHDDRLAKLLRGLTALLLYFSNNYLKEMIKECLPDAKDLAGQDFENIKKKLQQGIAKATTSMKYKTVYLERPVSPDEIKKLIDYVSFATEGWQGRWRSACENQEWRPVVNVVCTWGYGCPSAYSILLFATRDFIRDVFPNYSKLLPAWSEDNCPWDYDHILPQDWIDPSNPNLKEIDICERMANSIGNLAPLPFSVNRAKHAENPGPYYPFARRVVERVRQNMSENYESFLTSLDKYRIALHLSGKLEFCDVLDKTNKDVTEEAKNTATREFCQMVMMRFFDLYKDWYESLGIDELLDVEIENDLRRKTFDSLKAEIKDCDIWVINTNGHDVPINEIDGGRGFNKFDWFSTKALAFGKVVKLAAKELMIAFQMESSGDGYSARIGLRKTPFAGQCIRDYEKTDFPCCSDSRYKWDEGAWYCCRALECNLNDQENLIDEIALEIKILEGQRTSN